MKAFIALCFVVMLSFLFVPNIPDQIQESSSTKNKAITQPVNAEEKKARGEEIPEFSEDLAKKNANLFMEALKQETDENYKVINYSSKEELISHLTNYVSEDIVAYYTDGLFEERESSLYIIPTELPPWLEEEKPVNIKQLSDKSFRVYQKNSSELYGIYEITLGYEYIDGKWIITFASVD
ncbi:hypothetical protein [Fictibacillus phosphorivorans]|uniref:hypothetical protein n=1 Tax=Fictibacillus phosphorivorans TaxID=1221500 RepID=UPI00203FA641|nr:hypothetical protein [Fictibacillus phosphorivorans]MCM3718028.1 hypothetical protein [Fictibacillus phosphorivorans]MCM3775477.1 hypothetical protein [Fictibacillus phosphorivorans]